MRKLHLQKYLYPLKRYFRVWIYEKATRKNVQLTNNQRVMNPERRLHPLKKFFEMMVFGKIKQPVSYHNSLFFIYLRIGTASRSKSTKTRIETPWVLGASVSQPLLPDQSPLKQGLKQCGLSEINASGRPSRSKSTKTRIETARPSRNS